MITHAPATFTLRDVARIAYRFRLRAMLLFLAIMAATIAYIALATREYASEARIFVRLGRESVSLDPTAAISPMVSINESREGEINSVVEILNSRALAEEIVDLLGPTTILEPQTPEDDAATSAGVSLIDTPIDTVKGWLAAVHLADPVNERDRAITEFMESLAIEVGKNSTGTRTGSNVITLGYSSYTPEQAQLILSTLLDAYQNKHAEAYSTNGSLEFFETQAALLASNLEQRSAELRDAKTQRQLTSLDTRRSALEEQRQQNETSIRTTQAAVAASEAQVASLRATLAAMPERTVTESISGFPNVAADTMRDTLYELEIREQELLSKYTDDHPSVIAVRQQVAEAQAIVDQQETGRIQETTSLNPTYQPLELELLRAQATLASQQAHLATLTGQHNDLLAALERLNDDEVVLDRLEREVEMLEANYREYSENLEQARIDDALEAERISNINVVQTASISSDPIRPAKGAILVLGTFLAVGASVGLVVISYRLDQSFQTPDQLTRAIDVPVWGSVAHHTRSILPLP